MTIRRQVRIPLHVRSRTDSAVQDGALSRETEHSLAQVYEVDPLRDPRWQTLVEQHPHASVYHTAGWLQALHHTYGYEPVAFTDSPPTSDLKKALLFCDIRSWLTGHRMVSLPFSDHCAPLCDGGTEFASLIGHLHATGR